MKCRKEQTFSLMGSGCVMKCRYQLRRNAAVNAMYWRVQKFSRCSLWLASMKRKFEANHNINMLQNSSCPYYLMQRKPASLIFSLLYPEKNKS